MSTKYDRTDFLEALFEERYSELREFHPCEEDHGSGTYRRDLLLSDHR